MTRAADGFKHLQVVIPDDLHREVKAAAAKQGLTLTDYVERQLRAGLPRRRRGAAA